METPDERRARMTANTRVYRARHPQRVKESRMRVYWGRKKRAMDLLGGAICCSCGCDEITYLEFNHIDGGGCIDFRENGNTIVDRLLSGKRDPTDLNVLCRVCNAIEFLQRKNPAARGRFLARWEQFTGKTAVLEKQ